MNGEKKSDQFKIPDFIEQYKKYKERKEEATSIESQVADNIMKNQETFKWWGRVLRSITLKGEDVKNNMLLEDDRLYPSLYLTKESKNRELTVKIWLDDSGEMASIELSFPFRIHFSNLFFVENYMAEYNLNRHENPNDYKDEMYVDPDKGCIYLQRYYYIDESMPVLTEADKIWDEVLNLFDEGFISLYGVLNRYSVGKFSKEESNLYASVLKDSLAVLTDEWVDYDIDALYGLDPYLSHIKIMEMDTADDDETNGVRFIPIGDDGSIVKEMQKDSKNVANMFAKDSTSSYSGLINELDQLINQLDETIEMEHASSFEALMKNADKDKKKESGDALFESLLKRSEGDLIRKELEKQCKEENAKDSANKMKDEEESNHDN